MDVPSAGQPTPTPQEHKETPKPETPSESKPAPIATEGKIIPVKLGDLGEGTKEATIKKWFVKEGQVVKEFDDLCEVITDKLVAKIPSSIAGTVKKIHMKEEQVCQVGGILLDIMSVGDSNDEPIHHQSIEQPKQEAPKQAVKVPEKAKEPSHNVLATPAIRNLAKKLKIDLSLVVGTGKDGRITEKDVTNAAAPKEEPKKAVPPQKAESSQKAAVQEVKHPEPVSIPTPSAEDKYIKITGVAKAMTKSMSDLSTVPLYNIHDDVCLDGIKRLRQLYKEMFKDKISMTPILIKAYSIALTEFPVFNGQVNYQTDKDGYITEYIERADHNISVAVDTPNGLIVPNIKAVQKKSLLQVNKEVKELIERARNGKCTKEDLENGSFTVSNIGGIGGKAGTPLIFRPQIAIGAVGVTRTEPKFIKLPNGEYDVKPTDVVTICLTVDHRIVDGATGARFQLRVKQLLEKPELMAFYLK